MFATLPFDPASWHRRQADLYEQGNDWPAACWHLSRLISLVPPETMLYRRRARLNLLLEHWQEALVDADKAIELGANAPGPWNNKGIALANLGRWDQARAALEKAAAYPDADTIVWNPLTRTRARQGDVPGYRAAGNTALAKLNAGTPEIQRFWALWACAVAPEGPGDPNRMFQEANRASPSSDLDWALVRGAALYRAGQWQNAVQELAGVDQMQGRYLQAPHWFFRAMANARLGRPEAACADFDKAVVWLDQHTSGGDPVSVRLGKSTISFDCFLRAEMDLLRQEAAKLISAPHFRGTGQALQSKQWKEAIVHLDELIKANATHPGFLEQRALCYVELKHYAQAAVDFTRLTELGSTDWEVFVGLGITHLLADDMAGYRRACVRLLDRYEKTMDLELAIRVAGACKFAAIAPEDTSRAVKLAEKCVAANPGNKFYLATLGALLYRAGRFDDANRRMTESEQGNELNDIWCWGWEAMSNHRLGRDEAEKKALGKARALLKRYQKKARHRRPASIVWSWNSSTARSRKWLEKPSPHQERPDTGALELPRILMVRLKLLGRAHTLLIMNLIVDPAAEEDFFVTGHLHWEELVPHSKILSVVGANPVE